MKLTYFYITIEVAPRDGYNESLQCCTDRNDTSKLKFTFPYGEITPEQAAAVSEFTKTLTAAYNKLQKQIDNVNQELKLEQYATITPPVVKTNGSDFDLDAESAVTQPERGGSEGIDNCPSMEGAKEETVIITVRGSSNEGLTVIEEDIFGE